MIRWLKIVAHPVTVFLGGLLVVSGAAEGPIDAAPTVGSSGGFERLRPEIYRSGWIDFNKNGQKDVFEDPEQSTARRVDDLLARMTLEERISQLEQGIFDEKLEQSKRSLLLEARYGSLIGAARTPALRNRLQRIAVEDSRLGIPLLFGYDTIHGFHTTFPIPLAQAATWDLGLIEKLYAASAHESAAGGVDWVFMPMIDIARDPRWGRISESPGEDPWLAGRIAEAAVKGLQGQNLAAPTQVIACLKHFVGYGAAEGGRDYNTTEISPLTLQNVYLQPFRMAVAAGAASLMSAFNAVNGVPATGNRDLLVGTLRDQWGFSGVVVSDWNAITQLVSHGFAADAAEAARRAFAAGVDVEMVSNCYEKELPALLAAGRFSVTEIDDSVRRVLTMKFRKGLFERPYSEIAPPERAAMRQLAREAVAASVVLLRNEREILPIAPSVRRVAVIGPFGRNRFELLGAWKALGQENDVISIVDGLKDALPAVEIVDAPGCEITGMKTDALASAIEVAQSADLVILALGEPADYSGERRFRSELGLPGVQAELFRRVAATGKPLVTLLFAGRPLAVPEVFAGSDAVLMAWHPGVEAGSGLADVLTGKVSPSGRLTTTIPQRVGQVPVHYNYLATSRPRADYVDGPRAPLRPFGFGLTYGKIEYSRPELSSSQVEQGAMEASAWVTNRGTRAVVETVQLYIRDLACSLGARPMRELRGFRRVFVEAGQRCRVKFTVRREDLGSFDASGKYVVEPGHFELTIAPDAESGEMIGFEL